MNMTEDREWMRRMAEMEEGCCVAAGGLPAALGMLRSPAAEVERHDTCDTRRIALARFVEFSRRRMGLDVEGFAARAHIQPAEILQLEDGDAPSPEPRVIFAVASLLKADSTKLMELAGHAVLRDEKLEAEAARFAAWSPRSQPLSMEEERMLGEFARAVVASTD